MNIILFHNIPICTANMRNALDSAQDDNKQMQLDKQALVNEIPELRDSIQRLQVEHRDITDNNGQLRHEVIYNCN